jgi:hypothetical protein
MLYSTPLSAAASPFQRQTLSQHKGLVAASDEERRAHPRINSDDAPDGHGDSGGHLTCTRPPRPAQDQLSEVGIRFRIPKCVSPAGRGGSAVRPYARRGRVRARQHLRRRLDHQQVGSALRLVVHHEDVRPRERRRPEARPPGAGQDPPRHLAAVRDCAKRNP